MVESPAHCEITVHHTTRKSRVRGPQVKSTTVKRLARSEMKLTPTEAGAHAEVQIFPSKTAVRSYKRKDLDNRVYVTEKERLCAIEKAEILMSSLGSRYPSFVKPMLQSHVTGGFWLGFPNKFCQEYLPCKDEFMTLVDEQGEEFHAKYLVAKTGLSGGWRGFSIYHKLLHGDALVFQLVKPTKLKVYIVKPDGKGKQDQEFDFPTSDGHENLIDVDSDHAEEELTTSNMIEDDLDQLPLNVWCMKDRNSSMIVLDDHENVAKQSRNANDVGDSHSNILEVFPPSGSDDDKEMKSFECFPILVNGISLDTELSDHHKIKYYELCKSQDSVLHDRLLKSISYKLAAEIISETVNISESIKACHLSTSEADFETWGKTLEGFQLLGLNVGALHTRLSQLTKIALKSKEGIESESCREAELDRARVKCETESIELRLLKSKEKKQRLDAEIEELQKIVESHELIFKEVINSPW